MRAAIVLTGDEITKGIVKDTDGGYLAETLTGMGFYVCSLAIVPDCEEAILRELNGAFERADLIVITGGLGSTFDDITLATVAKFTHKELDKDREYHDKLVANFRKRFNREAPTGLERQSYVIRGSIPLDNRVGSARGAFIKLDSKEIVILPGPPMELKAVFESARRHLTVPPTPFTRTIGFLDLTEPEIETLTEQLLLKYSSVKFVTRVKYFSGPTVIISSDQEQPLEEICALFKQKWGEYIYTTTGEELIEVLVRELAKKKLTVSVAESCSGGRLASLLTSVSGASKVFPGGLVAYSDRIKNKLLSVEEETLSNFGAVSRETVLEMASGAKNLFNTDIALAISGVAGLTGGTSIKTVGLVWSALVFGTRSQSFSDRFSGDRETVQLRSAHTILKRLWRTLWKESSIL